MARGRIIFPDFWTDGVMLALPALTRLFYIGTWNFALCDFGHLPDDAMGLKFKILPADQVDADSLVGDLLHVGRLERLTISDGRTFLLIPKFAEWQTRDTRNKPRCPVCRDTNPTETHMGTHENTETHTNPTKNTVEGRGGEMRGNETRGREAVNGPPPIGCPQHPNGTDAPCRACGDARRAHAAWKPPVKPTASGVVTDPDCPKHPHRPARGCDRCAEEAA